MRGKYYAPDFSDANCKDLGTDLFFPESRAETEEIMPLIVKVCSRCPIYTTCLEYALTVKVEGIWAGTTAEDRRKIRRRKNIKAVPIYDGEYVASQTDEAKQKRKERAKNLVKIRQEKINA